MPIYHILITPTSQKLQKKALFVIMPLVESSSGDSLTGPDLRSEDTPNQGFEIRVLLLLSFEEVPR